MFYFYSEFMIIVWHSLATYSSQSTTLTCLDMIGIIKSSWKTFCQHVAMRGKRVWPQPAVSKKLMWAIWPAAKIAELICFHNGIITTKHMARLSNIWKELVLCFHVLSCKSESHISSRALWQDCLFLWCLSVFNKLRYWYPITEIFLIKNELSD